MRNLKFAVGEYYHLYNRGVDKRTIFLDDSDYSRFSALLWLCNSEKPFVFRDISALDTDYLFTDRNYQARIVSIGAYCLMPNHFHILIKEIREGGITRFMHRLSTAYTMYFNTKLERTGVLFQGRFKAQHLDFDPYLKYVFSYIHLNPVKLIDSNWKENGIRNKQRAKSFLYKYSHSSYLDYCGEIRKSSSILNQAEFPDYFPTKDLFDQCIEEWLSYKDFTEAEPLKKRRVV